MNGGPMPFGTIDEEDGMEWVNEFGTTSIGM